MKSISFHILIFLGLFSNINSNAQAPLLQWQHSFGGIYIETGNDIISLPDHSYMIAGTAESYDGDVFGNHGDSLSRASDFWILHLDSSGSILSQHCFGGSEYEFCKKLIALSSYNFLVYGSAYSADNDVHGIHPGPVGNRSQDHWLLKFDSAYAISWDHCYGDMNDNEPGDIIKTSDGGFLFTSNTQSYGGDIPNRAGFFNNSFNVWTCKVDSNGTILWSKIYGGNDDDYSLSCLSFSDGSFLIAGSTSSNDSDVSGNHGNHLSADLWVFKIDSIGTILWQRCYGGSASEFLNTLHPAPSNGFYVIGNSSSHDGDVPPINGQEDAWVLRSDSLGTIIWSRTFGGSGFEEFHKTCSNYTGGIVLTGYTISNDGITTGNHGVFDMWVVSIDSLGNFEWGKCLGGTHDEEGNSIIQTPDSGYLVTGYSQSSDGDCTFNHGDKDLWVVKLNFDHGLPVEEKQNTLMELTASQYNDGLFLRFFSTINEKLLMSLYDSNGKLICSENIEANEGANYHTLNCRHESTGTYILKLQGKKNTQSVKVVVE